VYSTTAHRLAIAFGHSSAAVLFRPLEFQSVHAIISMRQRAAAPPLGGSKYELNDHLSRLSSGDSCRFESEHCLEGLSALHWPRLYQRSLGMYVCCAVLSISDILLNDCMVC
jgi:hypothetical protein